MSTLTKKLLRCKEEWEKFKENRKWVYMERMLAETDENEPSRYPAIVVYNTEWFEDSDGIRMNTCSYLFVYRENFIKTELEPNEV